MDQAISKITLVDNFSITPSRTFEPCLKRRLLPNEHAHQQVRHDKSVDLDAKSSVGVRVGKNNRHDDAPDSIVVASKDRKLDCHSIFLGIEDRAMRFWDGFV